jgi:hypothetical protein
LSSLFNIKEFLNKSERKYVKNDEKSKNVIKNQIFKNQIIDYTSDSDKNSNNYTPIKDDNIIK